MKIRIIIFIGIFVGIIAAIAALGVQRYAWAQQPPQFTIAVTGQPGLAFTGVIKADGPALRVSGVVPANYVVTGHSVDCRFQKQQQVRGALGVCLRMRQHLNGTSAVSISEPGGGVCAFLSFHQASASTFTSLRSSLASLSL